MNRSFRAHESQMQTSVQRRPQGRNNNHLGASMMKEKEEELAWFLEMRKREKERNDFLLNSEEFDAPLGSKPGSSPIFKIVQSAPARKTATDDFLNSDNDKSDYDWLLTPPGTPLFPSLEMESQKTVISEGGTLDSRRTALKSRLVSSPAEPAPRSNLASRQPAMSPGLNTSSAGIRRPSSSGGRSTGSTASRPATPTGRPTLTSTTKASRPSTPTSRATLSSSRITVPPARFSIPSARSSTPTVRPTLSANKSTLPASRSVPASKSTSRSATPTRQPSTPSSINVSGPPSRSSSVTRSGPTITRNPLPSRGSSPAPSRGSNPVPSRGSSPAPSRGSNPVPSRGSSPAPSHGSNPVPSQGSSPTVKSRSWKPSEMPGFSLEAPPNLRTTMPDRPVSATRGRPGAPSSRSGSVEPVPNGRSRRQSCSPSRGRAPNGSIHSSGSSVPAFSRTRLSGGDNVSPVLIGTKMVERVVNMRKLAPPKQDNQQSTPINSNGKSSSPDSSGFGRNLSKKSLDMALRHMDIRRSIPGSMRPLMTNIPASSMYSVRSGPVRSRTVSVSDSPLATCSNASSESVNNNTLCLDASDIEDNDIVSERRDRSSPASQSGR